MFSERPWRSAYERMKAFIIICLHTVTVKLGEYKFRTQINCPVVFILNC